MAWKEEEIKLEWDGLGEAFLAGGGGMSSDQACDSAVCKSLSCLPPLPPTHLTKTFIIPGLTSLKPQPETPG